MEVAGNILISNNNYYEAENTAGANVAIAGLTSSNVTILGGVFAGAETAIRAGAGGEGIRIDSSGNVGIGTTSPASALDLGDGSLTMGNDDTTGSILFGDHGNYIARDSADGSLDIVSGQDDIILLPTANVGIGTSSPSAKLTIDGGNLSFVNTGEGIKFRNRNDLRIYENAYRLYLDSPSGMLINIDSNNNEGDIFNIHDSGTSRLYIEDGGNVGIGTSSPDVKLEVAGAVHTSRLGTYGTYNSAQVQGIWSISEGYPISTASDNFGTQYGMGYAYNQNGGAPFASEHQIVFTNAGVIGAAIGFLGSGYFKGDVGIGVTAPTVSFEVACPAGFTNIKAADNQLGCMQTAEEGFGSWESASDDCFDTYGGRLPTTGELYIAMLNYALTSETDDYEWCNDATGNDYHSTAAYSNIATQNDEFDSSSYAYRCWIPR